MKYVLATLQSVLTILFAYRLFHSESTFSALIGLFGTALFATLAYRNIQKIREEDAKMLFGGTHMGVPPETPATMPIHPTVNAGPFANDLINTPTYTATANTLPTGHNSTLNASVPQAPWTQDSGVSTAGTMIGGMALGAAGYAVAQAWTHEYAPTDHGMLAPPAAEPAPATPAVEPTPVTSTVTETTSTPDTSYSAPSSDFGSSGGSFE